MKFIHEDFLLQTRAARKLHGILKYFQGVQLMSGWLGSFPLASTT